MNATLGKPLYEMKGKFTFQKEIDSNKKQYTYSANGTINGNIEVTDTGEFVFEPKGNNAIFDQGAGKITTKDGSEIADYTFNDVGNGTDYQGSLAFSPNSTGKLSSLNNIVVIFKGGYDENGNFTEKGLEVGK
jgi:hypothetical protein